MLLLSRRVGESILLGHEIQIRNLSVSGEADSVSIGIKALDTVTVWCREVGRKVIDEKPDSINPQKRRWQTLMAK